MRISRGRGGCYKSPRISAKQRARRWVGSTISFGRCWLNVSWTRRRHLGCGHLGKGRWWVVLVNVASSLEYSSLDTRVWMMEGEDAVACCSDVLRSWLCSLASPRD